MDDYETLSHTKWDCKYHVVFIPRYGRKTPYGELRRQMGEMFRALARQKERQVLEGHLMPGHVHMLIAIPPKYSEAQVIGYIKGKSTIHVARTYFDRKRNFVGAAFLGPGLLRLDRGSRRTGHSRVHPEPGGGGQTAGAAQTAVGRHL
jgi:putative transposase